MRKNMIEVREYDHRWPFQADAVRADLEAALPGVFREVEHVGSTSVPGLAAKPIIDLMAAVTELDEVRSREDRLVGLGYRLVETGMPNRLLYARPDEIHLHAVTLDTWSTRNERLLRDHLRGHPADRDRYAALKRELRDTVADGDAYTRAKTSLIQELVDRARAERGLPAVPVWEE
jgi:GrpB-like predicted nucleotidyltransferase (UPF0157 family)